MELKPLTPAQFASWHRTHKFDSYCPLCAQELAVETPTIDISTGAEGATGHRQERIIRVQRIGSLMRVTAALRLDPATIHTLGTLTIPARSLPAVIQALTQLATDHKEQT